MADLFLRNKFFLFSFLLLFGSLQLFNSSVRNPELAHLGSKAVKSASTPFETGYTNMQSGFRGAWNRYIWLQGVEEKNQTLEERLLRLEAENLRLLEAKLENSRLRSLLSFAEELEVNTVAGIVIGRDPSNWVKKVSINIGQAHGLRPGLPVLDGKAVVGFTTVVASNSSKVLLLTDPTSAIDALVQRTRAPGVVESNPDGGLTLRYVVKEDDISIGDKVVTSGLGGVFPKGILIGIVTAVDSDVNGLFQNVTLTASADLKSLENVMVVTGVRPRQSQEPATQPLKSSLAGAEEEAGT